MNMDAISELSDELSNLSVQDDVFTTSTASTTTSMAMFPPKRRRPNTGSSRSSSNVRLVSTTATTTAHHFTSTSKVSDFTNNSNNTSSDPIMSLISPCQTHHPFGSAIEEEYDDDDDYDETIADAEGENFDFDDDDDDDDAANVDAFNNNSFSLNSATTPTDESNWLSEHFRNQDNHSATAAAAAADEEDEWVLISSPPMLSLKQKQQPIHTNNKSQPKKRQPTPVSNKKQQHSTQNQNKQNKQQQQQQQQQQQESLNSKLTSDDLGVVGAEGDDDDDQWLLIDSLSSAITPINISPLKAVDEGASSTATGAATMTDKNHADGLSGGTTMKLEEQLNRTDSTGHLLWDPPSLSDFDSLSNIIQENQKLDSEVGLDSILSIEEKLMLHHSNNNNHQGVESEIVGEADSLPTPNMVMNPFGGNDLMNETMVSDRSNEQLSPHSSAHNVTITATSEATTNVYIPPHAQSMSDLVLDTQFYINNSAAAAAVQHQQHMLMQQQYANLYNDFTYPFMGMPQPLMPANMVQFVQPSNLGYHMSPSPLSMGMQQTYLPIPNNHLNIPTNHVQQPQHLQADPSAISPSPNPNSTQQSSVSPSPTPRLSPALLPQTIQNAPQDVQFLTNFTPNLTRPNENNERAKQENLANFSKQLNWGLIANNGSSTTNSQEASSNKKRSRKKK